MSTQIYTQKDISEHISKHVTPFLSANDWQAAIKLGDVIVSGTIKNDKAYYGVKRVGAKYTGEGFFSSVKEYAAFMAQLSSKTFENAVAVVTKLNEAYFKANPRRTAKKKTTKRREIVDLSP